MSSVQRSPGRGPARSATKERFWRQQVSRHARSKLTVRDYCAQAGISEPSFYAWRSELARRNSVTGRPARSEPTAAGGTVSGAGRPLGPPVERPRFLPVMIAGYPPAGAVASHVEVVLPSGLLIRVPAQDAAALRTVLELLEPQSC
jgi:hypothetical protein